MLLNFRILQPKKFNEKDPYNETTLFRDTHSKKTITCRAWGWLMEALNIYAKLRLFKSVPFMTTKPYQFHFEMQYIEFAKSLDASYKTPSRALTL